MLTKEQRELTKTIIEDLERLKRGEEPVLLRPKAHQTSRERAGRTISFE